MTVLPYRVPITAVLVLVGLVLVAAVLVDMFHTLWHPRGFGTGARIVFKTTWRAFKLLPARVGRSGLAGPLGLFFTAVLWTTTLVLGFALVYLPFIPDGFNYGSSLNVGRSSSFLTAVYVSLVALATLGLGDIVPSEPALRVLVPLQALVGFALLTGAISWVLQLYPALTRRRAVARRLHSLAEVDTADQLSQLEPSVAVMLLEDVRADLATIEMDLLQYGDPDVAESRSSEPRPVRSSLRRGRDAARRHRGPCPGRWHRRLRRPFDGCSSNLDRISPADPREEIRRR